MSQSFNYDRAAAALVDAALMGDDAAAKKYEVSVRSIQLWRARIDTDPKLAGFFQKRKKKKDDSWADEIPAALSACIDFLKGATQVGDRTDPDVIAAINKSVEVLSDVALTWKVIDARIGEDSSETEAD